MIEKYNHDECINFNTKMNDENFYSREENSNEKQASKNDVYEANDDDSIKPFYLYFPNKEKQINIFAFLIPYFEWK